MNLLKRMLRKVMYPFMPKYEFQTMLSGSVGYIAKNGKTVMYGKNGNYNKLHMWGLIP